MVMMFFFKFLGIVLLSSVGYFIGREKVLKIQNEMLFWKEMDKFLCQTEECIRYQALPLSQVFQQLQAQADYPHLNLDKQQSFQAFQFPPFVRQQDRLLFTGLFQSLGQSTGQAMCEQIQYYLEQCKHHWQQLEQEYAAAVKIYPKSYLCIGLLLALVLL